jgi:23S rRNA (adenine2503-C2)-methyltransferase
MGEPTFNHNVIDAAVEFRQSPAFNSMRVHPVVSTMMPRGNVKLHGFLNLWMMVKNGVYAGNAGLQLSINSTDEDERTSMFGGSALSLAEIYHIMQDVPDPKGRKITLNFAVADYTIDPQVLLAYFSPEKYIIKLTPMHKTRVCVEAGNLTAGDYTTYAPYQEHEDALKAAGYDVLVFIASKAEDEGRITCGNAILSGTRPFDLEV